MAKLSKSTKTRFDEPSMFNEFAQTFPNRINPKQMIDKRAIVENNVSRRQKIHLLSKRQVTFVSTLHWPISSTNKNEYRWQIFFQTQF